MESKNNILNMYQQELDKNKETKESFINADNESISDSSSDEEPCKLIIPKRKNKKSDTSSELLSQLINQHKDLSLAQKKLFKVKNELNALEITSRYVKLDLNNAQVKIEENNIKFKEYKDTLYKTNIENMFHRILWFVLILFRFYLLF